MSKTEHIPFILGGQILDHRYPSILHPNPQASARRNRTMSEDEWNGFCRDFEDAMSWSRNWPICCLSRPVILTFTLWVSSVVLLVLVRASSPSTAMVHYHNNTNNHTNPHGYFYTHPANTFLSRELLPDLCVGFLLLLAVAMAVSMIQMSFQLQERISQVCDDYTIHYQDFCGLSFSIQKKPTIASPPWRGHAKQRRRANEYRSFLVITRHVEDATSRYQNVIKHPQDEMGNPPFFDVVRIPNLLPPGALISKALNERNHDSNDGNASSGVV